MNKEDKELRIRIQLIGKNNSNKGSFDVPLDNSMLDIIILWLKGEINNG